MIFQSFLLGNLVSLCMKIINSVVVVGLYYGFLITFSIGPSYLFLLRAQVMEEVIENKVSATTGFITGQLIMFISIYYAPMHLALGRPHTITVLALPYLLFHFFWNNNKNFFDYGSTTRNSMRNFSIQCVFLNNLIFQLFNHFILSSSMLARLINIYMFRCNNKMLFVTSSFVGWLIGHILFMKWLGLVLVWIRQNPYIRLNKYIRSNKYLVSKLINSMARIFNILLFITCVYYLGRIPSPIFTKKLKETPKIEQRVESEEESDKADPSKIDETEEIRVNGKEDQLDHLFTETGYKNKPFFEESYLMNITDSKKNSKFQKKKKTENKKIYTHFFLKVKVNPILNLLFDSNRWNQPFRYIKNTRLEGTVRNEMSQYFFDICQSDGKERISFTYLPSLSIFLEMIKRKISTLTFKKVYPNKLYNPWFYTNNQKSKNLTNAFINRIEALDKESISLNILETRTRICNDDYTKEYLSTRYDPLLNRSARKTISKNFSFNKILKKSFLENSLEKFWINRIFGILFLDTDYKNFEQKKKKRDKKTEIVKFLTFINRIIIELGPTYLNGKVFFLFSEGRIGTKFVKYFLTQIATDVNDQKIFLQYTKVKEIKKKVLLWSYKLITELEQESKEYYGNMSLDHEIRSRKGKGVVIFTTNKDTIDPIFDSKKNSNRDPNIDTNTFDQTNTEPEEVSLIHYSQKSDFRRGIIKGSMRSQRRKLVILELVQANAHSPLFLDRIQKNLLFIFFSIYKLIKRTWLVDMEVLKSTKEQTKKNNKQTKNKRSENARIIIAEAWDIIPLAQGIRGCMLLTQSFFRKNILLPSFIIAKNIGRILFFQLPEWSEDLQEWNRELHVKCTYNGVPLSETEFPKNWFTDGIQIKILFPFWLQPWNKSKSKSPQQNKKKKKESFSFLTVWGMETEFPFGSPRKRLSFFKPIFLELKKIFKKKYFRAITIFKKKKKLLRQFSNKTKKWVILITKKNKEFLKGSQIIFFQLRTSESKKYKKEKTSQRSNQIIHESVSQIAPSINSSLKKKNLIIKNLRSVKKTNYNSNNKFEKWKILKRRNDRIFYKIYPFLKLFIERIYANIILNSINIPKINTKLFLKLIKQIINKKKYIYNNEKKQEKIKNQITFFFKSLNFISNSKKNSYTSYDLSYISQAYVFFKLSQNHVLNLEKLRSLIHYQDIPLFMEPPKKDSFEKQGVSHSKFVENKFTNSEINQWKFWLKGHYQYNFSQINWSKLIPEKWRNTVRQCHIVNKDIFQKWHLYEYEKDQKFYYKKKIEVDSLYNKKDYRYDIFSYKFINYNYDKKKKCFFYISLFGENKKQDIYYISKEIFLNMLRNIPFNNYLNNNIENFYMENREKRTARKYFNMQIFNQNSQQIYQTNLSYLKIPAKNQPNSTFFFDWMGMNEKMLKHPISNFESWFFSEFILLYNTYKMKPWCIPSKLLFLNLNRKENINSSKKINEKVNLLIALKKKYRNKKENEPTSQGEILSQQKDIEENYITSDTKKKKQYKTETEFDFFLKRYLLFQLRCSDTFNINQRMINNIKVYCLLLRLIDPRKLTISSIVKRKIYLDIILIRQTLTLTEVIKKGIVMIEPIRLSIKQKGQFIMSQTINISSIHKSKHQTNQEKINLYKNKFAKDISTHQKIIEKRDQNYLDFFVLENILSFKCRRKFRILICFNSKNRNENDIDRNKIVWNKKSSTKVSHENEHLNKKKNKLLKLKLFIWPNYRLEDLVCMNRYWFATNNSSRFSMLRVYLYPRLKFFR
nr:photosystem I assembly protein Ycf1 [Christisonia kwangtungensis]UXR12013.1 photosystem I assembly protein Ycf1 [Christisonia kwangtungensis]